MGVVADFAMIGSLAFLMALHAGKHIERFFLKQDFARGHRTMAQSAIQARLAVMHLMGEVDKLLQAVDSIPDHRLLEFPDGWALLLDCDVARHALGFRRKPGVVAGVLYWVALEAFQSCGGMGLVREGQRLHNRGTGLELGGRLGRSAGNLGVQCKAQECGGKEGPHLGRAKAVNPALGPGPLAEESGLEAMTTNWRPPAS